MTDIKDKIQQSSDFYNKSFLNFDFKLADYGFQTLKPFFKGKQALEIGPATGYMTKNLVNEFDSLHVLEASENLLKQIPEYPNVIKINSLLEEFTTDLKFDTIVMSHVLEHISNPTIALDKIYNLLDSDGVFLVAVPNAKSIHRIVAVQMGLLKSEYELNQRDHELGHYRVYDMAMLEAEVQKVGFKILHKGGYFLKPLANSQIEKYWTSEMIDGFYKVGFSFPEICAEIFLICKK